MPIEDPQDLEAADQEIRINELREKVKEKGGVSFSDPSAKMAPDVEEQFLNHVMAFEEGTFTPHLEILKRKGLDLPPADTLDDKQLHEKLWELIRTLARQQCYLYNTNHLSDRELYLKLRDDLLLEEVPEELTVNPPPGFSNHLDIIGSGSEEDIELHHRYYADDEERADWVKEFPDTILPPKEKPPYDRDASLPAAQNPHCEDFEWDEDEDSSEPQ